MALRIPDAFAVKVDALDADAGFRRHRADEVPIMCEPVVPKPEYDDPKEIYAFFGLAYYCAQVLEQGLVNLAVALRLKEGQPVNYQDIDDLYQKIDKNTFGKVLAEVRKAVCLPSGLEGDLKSALEKRNYLAHQFFVVHRNDLRNRAGRIEMIDELRFMTDFIKTLDRQLDEHWVEAWRRAGISIEQARAEVERLVKGEVVVELPSKR